MLSALRNGSCPDSALHRRENRVIIGDSRRVQPIICRGLSLKALPSKVCARENPAREMLPSPEQTVETSALKVIALAIVFTIRFPSPEATIRAHTIDLR